MFQLFLFLLTVSFGFIFLTTAAHVSWKACSMTLLWAVRGPRARSRWRVKRKEEGVVVRTFMWDTSKHILVICYSNPGNSVQMHWITSWQSRVCHTVTAAAVTILDFWISMSCFSLCSLIQIHSLYFIFLSINSSEQSCYTVCHANESKYATNELSCASFISWKRVKKLIVIAFFDLLGYDIKGSVWTWK